MLNPQIQNGFQIKKIAVDSKRFSKFEVNILLITIQ